MFAINVIFNVPLPDWLNQLPDVFRNAVEDALKLCYYSGLRDGFLIAAILALTLVAIVHALRRNFTNGK